MSDEVDFLHAVKYESLLQTDSMGMVKNFQSSQHSKFAMSLRYLKKKFFSHESLLEIGLS